MSRLNLLSLRAVQVVLVWVLFVSTLVATEAIGVTYEFSGGRFGDNLLAYLHAKWLSYQYRLPLYYKPFLYSNRLVLSEKETHLDKLASDQYALVHWQPSIIPTGGTPVIYVCPYFPETDWEIEHAQGIFPHPFHPDWKDEQFKQEIRALIVSKHSLPLICPPQDKISVAIHYREGGGYDQGMRGALPLKFPDLDFYIEGLKKIVELTHGRELYCFVFTDSKSPQRFVDVLRREFPNEKQIIFDYRKKHNRLHFNVLEDFFSLSQFDLLIRPESNFSIVASLLHDFAICISPKDGYGVGDWSIVTEIDFKVEPHLLDAVLHRL